jgi:hypothetical protein
MADIHDNIAVCVFSFYENKMRYELFNTTDVKELKSQLHYSPDKDDVLVAGREITIKSETGKEKNYKITGIETHYFQGERFINRTLLGEKHPYNVQMIVWVDEVE